MDLPRFALAAPHVSVASNPQFASLPACSTIRGASDATEPDPQLHRGASLPDRPIRRRHARQSGSVATLGVLRTASLAVNAIGHGLALLRGRTTKHAIKQVDWLLSNEGIDIAAALRHWVP